MTDDTITINGEYTDAHIKTTNVDDYCIEQVTEMVNHEAFRGPVKIMPDAHGGAGAVIGFTMPLGERIVPNTVGVDIGCGMTAYRLGGTDGGPSLEQKIEDQPHVADERIRRRVPLGFDTFGDVEREQDYHIVGDFPWHDCHFKARSLNNNLDYHVDEHFGGAYFKSLCDRVGYDPKRAIDSLGTLGGGNHFIEVARSVNAPSSRDSSTRGEVSRSLNTGDYWVVVHSGSRGIGHAIAEYWQERAHENCDGRAEYVREELADVPEWAYKFNCAATSDSEILQWVQGGKGEDWKNTDKIAERLDGEEIGALIDRMNDIARHVSENGDGHDLDYLDGDLRAGYLKDMIFAQTYASQSRHKMCREVADALDATVEQKIVSTHNYIDFDDQTIRKGATRVHEGELGVIPFNMRDGAVIVRGKGNEDWNRSAPHGAGRRGSRTWAFDEFDVSEYVKEMQDVYSTSVTEDTLDEAPMAYKETDDILDRLTETATVEDELVPRINIKAED